MEEKIKSICEKYCGREIDADDELVRSKMISSFDLLAMICEIEEEYGIEFQPEEITELDNFSSASKITYLILKKRGCRNNE